MLKLREFWKGNAFIGTEYDDLWIAVTKGIINVKQIKDLAKKYECTITEFLGAAIIYSAYKSPNVLEKTKLTI